MPPPKDPIKYQEYIKRLSESGKRYYAEHPEVREKISKRTKGENNPNYGKRHSAENIQIIKECAKKQFSNPETRKAVSENKKRYYADHPEAIEAYKGENNPQYGKRGEEASHWKGGLTPLFQIIRNSIEMKAWKLDVFVRDKFTCTECGNKEAGSFNAHHIKPFVKILRENHIATFDDALNCAELWDINNGITLCYTCHKKVHRRKNR